MARVNLAAVVHEELDPLLLLLHNRKCTTTTVYCVGRFSLSSSALAYRGRECLEDVVALLSFRLQAKDHAAHARHEQNIRRCMRNRSHTSAFTPV